MPKKIKDTSTQKFAAAAGVKSLKQGKATFKISSKRYGFRFFNKLQGAFLLKIAVGEAYANYQVKQPASESFGHYTGWHVVFVDKELSFFYAFKEGSEEGIFMAFGSYSFIFMNQVLNNYNTFLKDNLEPIYATKLRPCK